MIIAIIHFGDGHVKPQVYDDSARLTDWHRAKEATNKGEVSDTLRITKIEVSKPLDLVLPYNLYHGRKLCMN